MKNTDLDNITETLINLDKQGGQLWVFLDHRNCVSTDTHYSEFGTKNMERMVSRLYEHLSRDARNMKRIRICAGMPKGIEYGKAGGGASFAPVTDPPFAEREWNKLHAKQALLYRSRWAHSFPVLWFVQLDGVLAIYA